MARGFRTGDQALVRAYNRAIILNLLRVSSPQSRADLAAVTGLNKTTVSSLVEELLARGLVREIGQSASRGRPAVLLELNPQAGYIIGAELGVRYLNVVLSDFRAGFLWRQQVQLEADDDADRALDKIVALVREAACQAEADGQTVLGLGLGTHGLVDVDTGTLLFGPNLGWRNVPIRRVLNQNFTFPIYVDNDAKTSALGEHYFGVARQVDNFVYVIANVGLGIGVVLGGEVHRGASGFAGEFGHTTIVPDGPLCRCGNRGCWETLASQKALFGRLRAAVGAGGHTSLPNADGKLGEVSMPEVVEAAHAGDELVLQALEETAVYLGIGIANLINSFNPSLVVFGGSLSLAADFLLPSIERVVSERAMPEARRAAQILVSAYRYDTCLMGGIALVLNDLLSHPRLDAAKRLRQQLITEGERR
jgi:glucokinase-like ROK family protein